MTLPVLALAAAVLARPKLRACLLDSALPHLRGSAKMNSISARTGTACPFS
jgi:hypothetical protein